MLSAWMPTRFAERLRFEYWAAGNSNHMRSYTVLFAKSCCWTPTMCQSRTPNFCSIHQNSNLQAQFFGLNKRVRGFWFEDGCRSYIAQLKRLRYGGAER